MALELHFLNFRTQRLFRYGNDPVGGGAEQAVLEVHHGPINIYK